MLSNFFGKTQFGLIFQNVSIFLEFWWIIVMQFAFFAAAILNTLTFFEHK